MPAMILCLMFTSFEPRFMILIYESLDKTGCLGRLLCRFNLLHYGSLVALYPLLMFTNFSAPLFLLMSCILLPQIYSNGLNGVRPDLASPYYARFIPARYLILVPLPAPSSTCAASRTTSSGSSPTTRSRWAAWPWWDCSTACWDCRGRTGRRRCCRGGCSPQSTTTSTRR